MKVTRQRGDAAEVVLFEGEADSENYLGSVCVCPRCSDAWTPGEARAIVRAVLSLADVAEAHCRDAEGGGSGEAS